MPRVVRICVVAVVLVLVALPASASATSGSEPEATASKACKLSTREQSKLGTTYVLSLRVRGTSCANGKKVVKAFHRCRRNSGGRKGRCRRKVLGYKCTERRSNVISTQFDSKATCKRSGREVSHKYTQNT